MQVQKSRFLLALLLAAAVVPAASAAELVLPRVSPKASVMQTVGLTDITVTYSRPGVKGRTIWGDLVPYGKVWRTGANEATVVSFSGDVEIQGNKLAAGSYSLHTIPAADQWTVIFNKEAGLWGSYSYAPEKDALRIQVTPRAVEHQEWLTFSFPSLGNDSTELILGWERLAVPIAIKTALVAEGFARIEKALTDHKSDAWRIPYRAADFAHNNDVRSDDAMKWIDQSLAMEENFFNLGLKARLLARKGDAASAIALGERALKVAKESGSPPETTSLERPLAEWKAGKK